jgi:hypothetical protein
VVLRELAADASMSGKEGALHGFSRAGFTGQSDIEEFSVANQYQMTENNMIP